MADVLDSLQVRPMTEAELARDTGRGVSSIHKALGHLVLRGAAERDPIWGFRVYKLPGRAVVLAYKGNIE